ncbi:MAG: hypothetical protein LQ339_008781 [Xanthoria mediterranea]|nr:MAG: hypothetical protein LQ339_008781 [Xanthoria mediterranea]
MSSTLDQEEDRQRPVIFWDSFIRRRTAMRFVLLSKLYVLIRHPQDLYLRKLSMQTEFMKKCEGRYQLFRSSGRSRKKQDYLFLRLWSCFGRRGKEPSCMPSRY